VIRTRRLASLACQAVAVPLLAVSLTATAPGTAPAVACTWKVVRTPNVGTLGSSFYGVTALSSRDAWAVGYSGANGPVALTLAEHWNGSSWTVVPTPSPGGSSATSLLYDVAAVSPTDIWAVGTYLDSPAQDALQTLVEHWNGTSWTVVPSPDPYGNTYDAMLWGVSAVSARDIWAVGEGNPPGPESGVEGPPQGLIEHWNGTSWTVVPSHIPYSSSTLYKVDAISARDAWAVGNSTSLSKGGILEHWNGTRWRIVRRPALRHQPYLMGVSATSASNVWAIGGGAYHWNGVTWRHVPTARPSGSAGYSFFGVAAASARNAWAVGGYQARTLIEHWDGTSWKVVPSPHPGESDILWDVAATTRDAWAVGLDGAGTTSRTLILGCR
jgi:hypothetical protein